MKNDFIDKFSLPLAIILVLSVISLITITPVLNVLVLGAILAYGLRPVANKLQRKIKSPFFSILIAIILVIVPLILLVLYIGSVVGGFTYSFISSNLGSGLDLNKTSAIIINTLPLELKLSITSFTSSLYGLIGDMIKSVLNYIFKLVKDLPFLSLQLFVLVFSMFYFTRDGDKLMEYVYTFIPERKVDFFNNMFLEVENVLKSIFYGHFITAFIIGSMAAIGYWLLGYPYALFFGILTGVLQLIPIIGPWPIYWMLAIYDLFSGNYLRVILVLLFGFLLSLSDMYIRPTLASKYADIHPMILLLGFLAGPFVFGLVGFILGPLILGITYAVIKTYKDEKKVIKVRKNNNNEKEK